ncbi:MAG: hypothetical protein ABIK47_06795 [candidate division WOR-3 bacterium]
MKRILTFTCFYLLLFLCPIAGCRKPSSSTKPQIKAEAKQTGETTPTLPDTQGTAITQFQSLLGEVFYGEKNGVDLTGLPQKLLYPNATPISRFGSYYPRFGCSYNLETKDSPAKVLAYYEKVLGDWKLVDKTDEEDYQSRSYVSAGRKEVVEVNVSRKKGVTVIVLCHTYRIIE